LEIIEARKSGYIPENFLYTVILALAVFLAHFSKLSQFGFYEDDYWATIPYIGMDVHACWDLLKEAFQKWPQGRPLNHSLPKIQAILGYKIAGVEGIYMLGYLGLVVNTALLFLIACRFLPTAGALICGLAYCLFPADSTHQFLVHTAHVQGALTFSLLGALLYLQGGLARAISYAVAALSLTAYETAFLPFLTIPLFANHSIKSSFAPLLRHWIVCGVIVGAYGFIRTATGESRVASVVSDPLDALQRIVSSIFIGPFTSGMAMIKAPLSGFIRADVVGIISACLLVAVLTFVCTVFKSTWRTSRAGPINRVPGYPALLLISLVTWVVAYLLTLTNYPPSQTIGRLTSTHTAAAWGAALFVGVGSTWLLSSALHHWLRKAFLICISLFFFGAMLYSNWVQRGYVHSWTLQRDFWGQVYTLCPDVGNGWSIIVTGNPAKTTPVMATNSWADILASRAVFGANINYAHIGVLGSSIKLSRNSKGVAMWTPEFWTGKEEPIDENKLILMHYDGDLLRRIGEVEIQGLSLHGVPNPITLRENRTQHSAIAKKLLGRR
jgi:hypothetical protein